MNREMVATWISSFIDIAANPYDERRNTEFWKPIFDRWKDGYEADKSTGRYSFSECARNSNIKAIMTILQWCESDET